MSQMDDERTQDEQADVEGHKRQPRADEDGEGLRFRSEGGTADVEGHKRQPRAVDGDEEGLRFRNEGGNDTPDVEGHLRF